MAAAAPAPANLNEFLYDIGQLDREKEISRVLSEFKLNPLAVLGLPSEPSDTKVANVYKRLSLLCHPDKVKPELRERAQNAFTLLAAAKAALGDLEKRSALNQLVTSARAKVIKKKETALRDLRKKERGQRDNNLLAAINENVLRMQQAADLKRDFTKDQDFEGLVHNEIKELIIEREWKKRQLMKAAAKEEIAAAAAEQEKKEEQSQKKEKEKKWEDNRDKRVGDWRSFMKKKGKKRKKEYKAPKMFVEDEEHTFMRRPAKKPQLAPGIGED